MEIKKISSLLDIFEKRIFSFKENKEKLKIIIYNRTNINIDSKNILHKGKNLYLKIKGPERNEILFKKDLILKDFSISGNNIQNIYFL